MQKSSMDYELAYAGRALCATCKNVKCAMLGIGMNTVCSSYETERKEAYTRPDKNAYYLGIAEAVAKRSTCLRRQYGAVIVQDGEDIIATGYNGAPRGEDNCSDLGECWRERNHIPHGERYEKCKAVHAEQNAIISAARRGATVKGGKVYLVGIENGVKIDAKPCEICEKMVKNAGLKMWYEE